VTDDLNQAEERIRTEPHPHRAERDRRCVACAALVVLEALERAREWDKDSRTPDEVNRALAWVQSEVGGEVYEAFKWAVVEQEEMGRSAAENTRRAEAFSTRLQRLEEAARRVVEDAFGTRWPVPPLVEGAIDALAAALEPKRCP
jgi:hypothetical protein